MKVLMIDNYDSFTYNLVQYLGELGAEVETVRNDQASVEELLQGGFERCVISPGPCTPDKAGISIEVSRRMPEAHIPTLGVCLGHQSMAQAFGGVVRLHKPIHGKAASVQHDGRTIFAGLPSPLTVGRYHSIVVDEQLPDCLEATATSDGVLMGLRHKQLPAEGVQFHPESVLTEHGKQLLSNFLAGAAGAASAQRPGTAFAQRPGTAFAQRPGTAFAQRPGTAFAQPPGAASAQRPGTAFAQRPSTAIAQPPRTG